MPVARTLTFNDITEPDTLATNIANKYTQWNSDRQPWLSEARERRNYIFQTSTRDTTNSSLPWKNSTSTPKLCQIRDNLHANYMAALFPNEEWLTWIGGDTESEEGEKRKVIQAYMRNKTELSNFRATVSQLVYDWIDYGNAMGTAEWVRSIHTNEADEEIIDYVGPRLVRKSPVDVVFNILSSSFEDSPKIIRTIKSIGDIKKDLLDKPELNYQEEILDKMLNVRQHVANLDSSDVEKTDGFQVDGFGNIVEYFSSGMVEILEFYGSLYDEVNDTFFDNHVITVVDRSFVIRKQPIPGWNKDKLRHVGWRLRPDNLMAMGPLDNLVGMQYRI
ncbi:MAG: portal protein, partial [Candidatus Thorarchaeota archaeon]